MKTKEGAKQNTEVLDMVRNLFVLLMILASQLLFAQDRLSVEFRPSANFPTSDFGSIKVSQGGGFEAVAAYRFMTDLSAYCGWGYNMFGSDNFSGPTSLLLEETGYTYGLQYIPTIKESRLSGVIRGGGVFNHIEVENGNGETVGDSGHGFGWQVEGGLAIAVSKKWNFFSTLRYRSLSRSIGAGSSEISGTLNYLSLGMGVCWRF